MSGATAWWRHLALGAATAGLLASPAIDPAGPWAAAVGTTAAALVALRPRPAGADGRRGPPTAATACWLALLVATGATAGLGVGDARLAALAGRAAGGEPGQSVHAVGHVAATPKRSLGEWRFPLQSGEGRVLVVAPAGADEQLAIGDTVAVAGVLAEPEPWRAAELRRAGAALELRARRLRRGPGGRAGLGGLLDRVRARAERGIEAGLDADQAALGRGFVLGQDDRIDERTREQFRRSGLAHLLAVSGQNVMLLAILCGALFALAGLGPAARAAAIVVVIAAYVPVAGAGPSIQRAGVMGVAGILAGLVGRGSDRAYLPLLAAVVTLALNPLAAGDVGWQLSFAAVLGIALWAAPIRDLVLARLAGPGSGRTSRGGRIARPLAEGFGLTVSATVATAPLMALHFERISLASLPANLLALPAVAPVMWLGMLASILAQLPFVPTAPVGLLLGPLLDYVAAVAELLAAPAWATFELPAPGAVSVGAVYLALIAGMGAALAALRRRRRLSFGRLPRAAAAVAALALGLAALSGEGAGGPAAVEPGRLRISALDVGQGDALLLQQAGRPSVLVDTGPPGAGLTARLDELGVDRLAAVVVTHDQLDHSGALAELLGAVEVDRLFLARPAPAPAALARAAGTGVERVAAGDAVELGGLRLQVLAPEPSTAGASPSDDPNADSLVLAARFERFSALLTGDAEAEASRIDPGPLDVLKIAHHGSADAGLEALLDRSAPRVALISVGANPHGHPAPETLEALAERSICVLRTDRDGEIWAELGAGGLRIGSSGADDPAGCSI